jgi:regulatory protein
MLIDAVTKYKGSTYEVALDTGGRVYLHQEVVLRYGLSAGGTLSEERLSELIRADTLRKARERALYLLDYRDYCYVELYERLEPNYPQDVCLEVLSRLVELGALDDARYAKNLAERLILGKHYGSYRAVRELRAKGIDPDLAESVVAEYEDSEPERLRELVQSKYARQLSDPKGVARVRNALVRLGYSYEDVRLVTDGDEPSGY